jgi:hypothetical protein
VIPEKLFWLLSIFCKFFKLSIWISCFRVLFGCNGTFEHPAYLNSGGNDVETYIYWILGKITVDKTWISINQIFANLMVLEGISTEDLYTKTYLMS